MQGLDVETGPSRNLVYVKDELTDNREGLVFFSAERMPYGVPLAIGVGHETYPESHRREEGVPRDTIGGAQEGKGNPMYTLSVDRSMTRGNAIAGVNCHVHT